MLSSRSQGEPKLPIYLKLNCTLQKINNPQNPANLADGIKHQHPPVVDAHNHVILENPGDDALRRKPPSPRPLGHTFVVTSSLMQMLTARGLFTMLPSKYPYAHIAKLRSVCKSCVGSPDFDMNIIGLSVFPLSLTGEAPIWFT